MSFSKFCLLGLFLLIWALFVPLPLIVNSAVIKAWSDVVHLPLFACLTFGGYIVLRRFFKMGFLKACVVSGIAGVGFAFGSEFLQGRMGRDPSMGDAVNNLFGIGAALASIVAWEKRSKVGLLVFAVILACGLMVALKPVRDASSAKTFQAGRLPLLGDFENDWELLLWQAQGDVGGGETRIRRDNVWAKKGTHSLRIEAQGAEWAGVHLLADPSDWSSYRRLLFDVKADGKVELGIRLDLNDGERYTGSVLLDPGKEAYDLDVYSLRNRNGTLPLGKLARVVRLVIHTGEIGHTGTIFLDNVRLE